VILNLCFIKIWGWGYPYDILSKRSNLSWYYYKIYSSKKTCMRSWIFFCFLVTHRPCQGNPVPKKIWIEPEVLYIWPDLVNIHHLVSCHQTYAQCKTNPCIYRWRVENKVLKESNEKYEIVDSSRSLLIKAPLSRRTNSGPLACVVEQNKKPLGQGLSFIKFLGK